MKDSLNDLEKRVLVCIEGVIEQFNTYPHTVPDRITLYNAEREVLDEFKDALMFYFSEKGSKTKVLIADQPNGYSIDVSALLNLTNNS